MPERPVIPRGYDPPRLASDPRVCFRCASVRPDASWFPILNGRSGVYHSGGDYGVTDCGKDATGGHWLWPM